MASDCYTTSTIKQIVHRQALWDGNEKSRVAPDRQTPHRLVMNKFHQGNRTDGKHYWLTPPDLLAQLDAEFHFDLDPCPYPLPPDFDGLTMDWGQSNYVNPPFGSIIHQGKKKGPTAWARKAIAEHKKGKRVVMVYPLPKWVLMLLEQGATVRNLGDVRWIATEDGSVGPGIGQHVACFILNKDTKAAAQHLGKLGGSATKRKHDPDYYKRIGRAGAAKRWQKGCDDCKWYGKSWVQVDNINDPHCVKCGRKLVNNNA